MRRPIVIEDPDERARRQREEDEERVLDQDERWERRTAPASARGAPGLIAWRDASALDVPATTTTVSSREPRGHRRSRSTSSIPTGARRATSLSPAGHVALFVRALHAPGAAALREQDG